MHIGLFFGTFNPVHIGHLALANYMFNFADMQQVWMVVSPHNPLKNKNQLLDQNDRLHLVNLALDFHPNIKSSNFEFDLPQPSYTINTLVRLKEKYPEHQFSLIMGQDNLQSFNKWKNYEEIIKRHHIYVYPRPNCKPSEFDTHPNVHITQAPLMDISSTFIRNSIKEKKDIRFFLHPKVWEEVDTMNFYKK
ncbi:MAG: nicotinate-nucleotide adenylyltransferase [Bacteroidetes bacterium]|nr:nicotinate-nucleotide adenylyltransferase [Bacteroidota bacterium]